MWGLSDEFLKSRATMLRYWPVCLVVNPDTKLQPVWAHDVAVAIINTLKSTKTLGVTYELAADAQYTELQIYEWVNFVLKTDKRIIPVKSGGEVEWHTAYWLGLSRKPRVTLDMLKDSQHKILSGNYPGFAALNVTPTQLFSPIGMASYLHLRPPLRAYDIGFSSQPEIPGIEKGTPSY